MGGGRGVDRVVANLTLILGVVAVFVLLGGAFAAIRGHSWIFVLLFLLLLAIVGLAIRNARGNLRS